MGRFEAISPGNCSPRAFRREDQRQEECCCYPQLWTWRQRSHIVLGLCWWSLGHIQDCGHWEVTFQTVNASVKHNHFVQYFTFSNNRKVMTWSMEYQSPISTQEYIQVIPTYRFYFFSLILSQLLPLVLFGLGTHHCDKTPPSDPVQWPASMAGPASPPTTSEVVSSKFAYGLICFPN